MSHTRATPVPVVILGSRWWLKVPRRWKREFRRDISPEPSAQLSCSQILRPVTHLELGNHGFLAVDDCSTLPESTCYKRSLSVNRTRLRPDCECARWYEYPYSISFTAPLKCTLTLGRPGRLQRQPCIRLFDKCSLQRSRCHSIYRLLERYSSIPKHFRIFEEPPGRLSTTSSRPACWLV